MPDAAMRAATEIRRTLTTGQTGYVGTTAADIIRRHYAPLVAACEALCPHLILLDAQAEVAALRAALKVVKGGRCP